MYTPTGIAPHFPPQPLLHTITSHFVTAHHLITSHLSTWQAERGWTVREVRQWAQRTALLGASGLLVLAGFVDIPGEAEGLCNSCETAV